MATTRRDPCDVLGGSVRGCNSELVVFAREIHFGKILTTAVAVEHLVRIGGVRRIIVGVEGGEASAPESAARILSSAIVSLTDQDFAHDRGVGETVGRARPSLISSVSARLIVTAEEGPVVFGGAVDVKLFNPVILSDH